MKYLLGLAFLCFSSTSAFSGPVDEAWNAFYGAKCDLLTPMITHDLGKKTYLGYSDLTHRTDSPEVFLQAGTNFIIKTKTFSFTGIGQSDKIIVERLKEQTMKMPDGFTKKVFVFEESAKCLKLWDKVVVVMNPGK